jgi:hypothetical protein
MISQVIFITVTVTSPTGSPFFSLDEIDAAIRILNTSYIISRSTPLLFLEFLSSCIIGIIYIRASNRNRQIEVIVINVSNPPGSIVFLVTVNIVVISTVCKTTTPIKTKSLALRPG